MRARRSKNFGGYLARGSHPGIVSLHSGCQKIARRGDGCDKE